MKKPVGGNCTSDNHCLSSHCVEADCVECISSNECVSGEKCEGYVCLEIAVLSEQSQLILGIVTAGIVVLAMAIFVFYTRRTPI